MFAWIFICRYLDIFYMNAIYSFQWDLDMFFHISRDYVVWGKT